MLNITALGRNGYQDWILQRVSAVILGLYIMFLLVFWLCMPICDNLSWHSLFHNQTMRLITMIALLSLMMHAWIGMWVVITDYIKTPILSLFTKVFIFLALTFYLFWGMQILWG